MSIDDNSIGSSHYDVNINICLDKNGKLFCVVVVFGINNGDNFIHSLIFLHKLL